MEEITGSIWSYFKNLELSDLIEWIVVLLFGVAAILSRKKKSELRAWKIPHVDIKGTVSEISCDTRNRSFSILALAKHPLTGHEQKFRGGVIRYKKKGFRLFAPKEQEILEYANMFVKVGDQVNIRVSLDNTNIYYIETPAGLSER